MQFPPGAAKVRGRHLASAVQGQDAWACPRAVAAPTGEDAAGARRGGERHRATVVQAAVQTLPQSMPLPDTVPVPLPLLETVRVHCFVNSAVTSVLADRVKSQLVVPAHGPLHPANRLPASAVAESDTAVSASTNALQMVPQSMPFPTTVPVPVPAFWTASSTCGTGAPVM
jgi:hypothetical protein